MTLVVTSTGSQCTLQDLGRPGYASLGVGRSGAFDRAALRRANRLVGNEEGAAGVECLLGGARFRARVQLLVCVTGQGAVLVDGVAVAPESAAVLPAGAELEIRAGSLRRYLAVRGAVSVPAVLGSAATDTLTGLGPTPLVAGSVLGIGAPSGPVPDIELAPRAAADPDRVLVLDAGPGPRSGLLTPAARLTLETTTWRIGTDCDRVGVRLDGPALATTADGTLPSEGMRPGSVEVPGDGRPVVFGPDHPVTGGYPVVAVLSATALDLLAQAGPGRAVRFRLSSWPAWADR